MIAVIDNNGVGWLYGQTNAMLLNSGSKAMTGTKFGDRNGYEFDFVGFEPVLAQSIDATTILTLNTAG